MIKSLLNKVKKGIVISTVVLASLLSPLKSHADDITKGMRGPTNWQVDLRTNYNNNSVNTQTLGTNVILKYWDGQKIGKWGFISVPYKYQFNENSSNNGFGNIVFVGGPRGTIKDLHWFSYLGLSTPTGKEGIGNKRWDIKSGALFTKLFENGKYELDGAIDYTIAEGDLPNKLYAGLLFAGSITNKAKVGLGITTLQLENGKSISNIKGVIRKGIKPNLFYEILGSRTIQSEDIPGGYSLEAQLRYNF